MLVSCMAVSMAVTSLQDIMARDDVLNHQYGVLACCTAVNDMGDSAVHLAARHGHASALGRNYLLIRSYFTPNLKIVGNFRCTHESMVKLYIFGKL